MADLPILEVFTAGMKVVGHSFKKAEYEGATKSDHRKFREAYNLSPEACQKVYQDLSGLTGDDRIENPCITQLFRTLRWLKTYPTENNEAGHNGCSAKTSRKYRWIYVSAIFALSKKKIKWPFELNGGNVPLEVFLATVDGTHCLIYEPRKFPGKEWCSYKFKKAGLAYEVAVGVWNGNIVWINGPFPASTGDNLIYQSAGGLKSKMPPGKKLIADGVYLSNPEISGRNPTDSKALAKFKERAKGRQETVFARLKNFHILSTRFRCKTDDRFQKHKMVFESCCALVQYDIENGHPLFQI